MHSLRPWRPLRDALVCFLVVLPLLAMAACDNSTTLTTTPTPINPTLDAFTGTLTVNGGVTHTFSTASRGSVTATLKDLQPDNTTTIGVSLGTWNGSSCQIVLANDSTAVGSGLLGSVSGVGNLCLRVYDVGKLTSAVSYSVDVTHP